jgi:UMF1 family MFS transporter
MQKKDNKVVNAWCMYDWANSAYNLAITSTLFPAYFINVTNAAYKDGLVQVGGYQVQNSALYSYSLSFAYLLAALLSPLLAAMADYGDKKKLFMQAFTYVGALACMGLFWFEGPNIWVGVGAFALGNLGYTGALVFYNSYLPDIVKKDRFNEVSARGYAFGYVGSVILLLGCLAVLANPIAFGFKSDLVAQRACFVGVGIWWLGFAIFSFRGLPAKLRSTTHAGNLLTKGYAELGSVWRMLRKLPDARRYLFAFFFYSVGVQTVMLLAATFAKSELKLTDPELVITILIIQLLAIPGAWAFAKTAGSKGNKQTIHAMLIVWICVCILAFIVTDKVQFFGLAGIVGLMMGGIQSMSRATYAMLIPRDTPDTASFFSFYDVMEKLSIVCGTAFFGFLTQLTGDMRNGALLLVVFFGLGLLILNKVAIPDRRSSVHQLRPAKRRSKD